MDQIMRSTTADMENIDTTEEKQKPSRRKLIVSIPLDSSDSEPNSSTDEKTSDIAAHKMQISSVKAVVPQTTLCHLPTLPNLDQQSSQTSLQGLQQLLMTAAKLGMFQCKCCASREITPMFAK